MTERYMVHPEKLSGLMGHSKDGGKGDCHQKLNILGNWSRSKEFLHAGGPLIGGKFTTS